jgi:hypothetical protein
VDIDTDTDSWVVRSVCWLEVSGGDNLQYPNGNTLLCDNDSTPSFNLPDTIYKTVTVPYNKEN